MEKKLTAMQMAIEYFEKCADEARDKIKKDGYDSKVSNEAFVFGIVVTHLSTLLPKEREAIEEAYKKGCKDTYGNDEPSPMDMYDNGSASDYFTQNYKQ